MRIVGLQPGVAAGRVAEVLYVHPSTLTGILQRLQARGLLQRKAALSQELADTSLEGP